MSKPKEPCEKCQFVQLSELETPCINCVHNHLGGSYPDYFQTSGNEPDPAPNPHKDDDGKPPISLVPTGIIWEIAKVREYGLRKYPDTGREGWRSISKQRIRDAMLRHCLKYVEDPEGLDEESGLSHLSHLATNTAFLIEMEGIRDVETD